MPADKSPESDSPPVDPAKVRPIPYDDEADDEPYGDPSKVKDEGPLESIGKAISEPLRDRKTKPDPGSKPD